MSVPSRQTVITIKERTPSPPSVREVSGKKVHLYYFQSPKNSRRFILCGQLSFYLGILLEAELDVAGYGPRIPDGAPGISAYLRGGARIDYETRYVPEGARAPQIKSLTEEQVCTADANSEPLIVTDQLVRDRQVQVENWIFLCAAMNRARLRSCENEAHVMLALLQQFGAVSFDTLLSQDGIDKACMLGAIGRAIQAGAVSCDTREIPITRLSTISLLRSAK